MAFSEQCTTYLLIYYNLKLNLTFSFVVTAADVFNLCSKTVQQETFMVSYVPQKRVYWTCVTSPIGIGQMVNRPLRNEYGQVRYCVELALNDNGCICIALSMLYKRLHKLNHG